MIGQILIGSLSILGIVIIIFGIISVFTPDDWRIHL